MNLMVDAAGFVRYSIRERTQKRGIFFRKCAELHASNDSDGAVCLQMPLQELQEMEDNMHEALEHILIDTSITEGFSREIGRGAFGLVYMGVLGNKKIAVKKLSQTSYFSDKQFQDELTCLQRIRHKNIVRFLGYCSETQVKEVEYNKQLVLAEDRRRLLSFEYVPNKSLCDYIKAESDGHELDTRYKLIEGICHGLCYLHNERITHLDLKPENILLDADMVPKITDFGLSGHFSGGQSKIITENIHGSEGYVAPKYWSKGIREGLCYLHETSGQRVCHRGLKAANVLLDTNMVTNIEDFGISRLCEGLHYLHEMSNQRICHMDLKPANILLDTNMAPNIEDFGISSLLGSGSMDTSVSDRALGMVGYTDPEYLSHSLVQRSDIFSFGVILIERSTNAADLWHDSMRRFLHIFSRVISMAPKCIFDMAKVLRFYISSSVCGAGWTPANPTSESPNSGTVSGINPKESIGRSNELPENESQHHSDPDSCHTERGEGAKTLATWVVATAARHHVTGSSALLSGFVTEHDGLFVHTVNKETMQVRARGAIVTEAVVLPDVWFVPGLTANLVSVSQLAELDYSIRFGGGACYIKSAADGTIVGKGHLGEDGQYVLDFLKVPLAL